MYDLQNDLSKDRIELCQQDYLPKRNKKSEMSMR